VSYGLGGTQCTVTDADLVLGYLDPDHFLGGRMTLDAEAAADAVRTQVAEPMGIGLAQAAWGIHATVNENMANAARVHAIERGRDPAGLPVFVQGGNGPLHGPGVARALGCSTLVVPPAAGVLSALGFLSAALSIDLVRSRHTELAAVEERSAADTFAEMAAEAAGVLLGSGVPADEIVHTRTLDMRFVGQGSEVEVVVPEVGPGWQDEVRRRFAEQYEERFGTLAPADVEVEVLTWRVTSRGPRPDARLELPAAEAGGDSLVGTRPAWFPETEGYVDADVHDRRRLTPGAVVEGPALVQEPESTLVLPPGTSCSVEKDGSLLVDLAGVVRR
jgi:N-methylhydantoinase A